MSVEPDEDDVPTDAEIAESAARGDDLFEELMDQLDREENNPVGVAYNLWVNLTRYLAEYGWTEEQLIKDLAHHVASQTSEGSA